jgi:hypothetical protein
MSCVSTVGLALPDFVRRGPDGFAFNVRFFSSLASMPISRRILAFEAKLPTKAHLANELALTASQIARFKKPAGQQAMLALTQTGRAGSACPAARFGWQ